MLFKYLHFQELESLPIYIYCIFFFLYTSLQPFSLFLYLHQLTLYTYISKHCIIHYVNYTYHSFTLSHVLFFPVCIHSCSLICPFQKHFYLPHMSRFSMPLFNQPYTCKPTFSLIFSSTKEQQFTFPQCFFTFLVIYPISYFCCVANSHTGKVSSKQGPVCKKTDRPLNIIADDIHHHKLKLIFHELWFFHFSIVVKCLLIL